MGECVSCGGRGLFVLVDKARLCRDCRRIVAYDVARPVRTIAASTALIGASGELAERLACLRDDCLLADTRYRLAAAKRNAEAAVGTKARVAAYRRALLAVKANRDEVRDAALLAPYEEELRLAMYGARLAGYLAAAQRLQDRGRSKRALDLYHEALYFLEIHDAAKQLTAERARLEEAMAAVGRPAIEAGDLIDGQEVSAKARSAWAKRGTHAGS